MSKSVFRLLVVALMLVLVSCGDSSPDETAELVELPRARGLVPVIAPSDHTFEDAHFSGGQSCSACHDDQATGENRLMVDDNGRDLSLVKAWSTSMMANSARDPYWHAVFASELSLYPDSAEKINDTCTRCHAPMANEVGRRLGQPIQLYDSGSEETGDLVRGILSMTSEDERFNHAMDGVSCSLCHQIAEDANFGTEAGMTGEFFIEDYSAGDIADRPAYGQYVDVDQGYMKANAHFTPVFGAHISTSEMCASCHNLETAPLDRNGVPVPGADLFPEQMVYTEWQNSDYNVGGPLEASCQSCHMPVVDKAVPIAVAGADDPREGFAEHTFLGANTVMMSMLDEWKEELGIDPELDFQEAIERNRSFLNTAAELEITSSTVNNDLLSFDVRVINRTGHKLPSGYHSRRVILSVLVTDANGQTVYQNGKVNPDGSIDGVIEDVNPEAYEPHYDVITEATQVQIYQSIMGNSDNELTHSLLNGTHYLKDNRLTPAGFVKRQVPDDVAVWGRAATQDADFNSGEDTVTYQVPVNGNAPYNVLVELIYQPLSFGHLQALFQKSDTIDAIDQFRTLYNALDFTTETITGVVATVE